MAQELTERMATMEATAEACQKTQDGRHDELLSQMKEQATRITRIEDKHVALLTTALFTLLGVVSTLIILILNLVKK